jgi:hypothetical protein
MTIPAIAAPVMEEAKMTVFVGNSSELVGGGVKQ